MAAHLLVSKMQTWSDLPAVLLPVLQYNSSTNEGCELTRMEVAQVFTTCYVTYIEIKGIYRAEVYEISVM